MDAVDAARHVLPVIDVCGFRVEDLKHKRSQGESSARRGWQESARSRRKLNDMVDEYRTFRQIFFFLSFIKVP